MRGGIITLALVTAITGAAFCEERCLPMFDWSYGGPARAIAMILVVLVIGVRIMVVSG